LLNDNTVFKCRLHECPAADLKDTSITFLPGRLQIANQNSKREFPVYNRTYTNTGSVC